MSARCFILSALDRRFPAWNPVTCPPGDSELPPLHVLGDYSLLTRCRQGRQSVTHPSDVNPHTQEHTGTHGVTHRHTLNQSPPIFLGIVLCNEHVVQASLKHDTLPISHRENLLGSCIMGSILVGDARCSYRSIPRGNYSSCSVPPFVYRAGSEIGWVSSL